MRYFFSSLVTAIVAVLLGSATAGNPAPSSGGVNYYDPSKSEYAEYIKDFNDFDSNRDRQIDGLEIDANFRGNVDAVEKVHFFRDADRDMSGTVSLQEYIHYAVKMAFGETKDEI